MGCSMWVMLRLLVVLAVIERPVIVSGISCGDAITKMIPCESFLVGAGPAVPSSQCCGSARSLSDIAQTSVPDRRALCQCFKQTASSFPVNLARAKQLPQLCKLSINIAIDPNVDCNKI